MFTILKITLLFATTAAYAHEGMHIPKPEAPVKESEPGQELNENEDNVFSPASSYLSTVPPWEAGGGHFAFPQETEQSAEVSEEKPDPSPERTSAYREARASADRFARRMHTWSPSWPDGEAEPDPAGPHGENMRAVFEGMLQAAEGPARLRALETIDDEASLENLNRIMSALVDRDPDVRAKARQLLETQNPEKIAERFIEGARQRRPELNQAIIETAPGMRERLEGPVLQRFTREDASTQERLAAAWLLTLMRSGDATESLAATAWDTSHEPLAIQCAQAIVAGEAPEAQRHLMEMTRHPFSDVRRVAIRALAQYGGPDALAVVQQVATGPHERDTTVREEAILLLGQWGDLNAVPALLQVLQQRPHLRTPTATALRQLTGQGFGPDPAQWTQWWRQVLQERGISPQQQQQAQAPSRGPSHQGQPGQPGGQRDPRGNIPQQQFLEQQRRRQQMQQQRAQEQPATPQPGAESDDESPAEQQPSEPSIGQGGHFIGPGQPGGGMESRSQDEIGGSVQPGQPGASGRRPQQDEEAQQPSIPQQPGMAPQPPGQHDQPEGVRQPNMPDDPEQDQPIEWSQPPQAQQQRQPMPQHQPGGPPAQPQQPGAQHPHQPGAQQPKQRGAQQPQQPSAQQPDTAEPESGEQQSGRAPGQLPGGRLEPSPDQED